MTAFNTLGLSETVLGALLAKGYTEATPIQAQAIPSLLQGKDLLGIAQTGTGKTAAFMLPSIDRLIASGNRALPRGCRMLVLAPTRELAAQIAESARDYAKGTPLKVVTVFGGTSLHKNRQDLARGVDVLVATPGRLVDLMDGCFAILSNLEILVLDEADQMMDLGFIHALKRIVRDLPAKRQSLFFSATMPKAIRELAGQFLKSDPVEVKVTPVATTAERVEQYVTMVQQAEKQALLTMALNDPAIDRALVFTRTKHGADRVVRLLAGNGVQASAIHGNKSQPQRERALGAFRDGTVKILVATDIAARGIDVSGVSHVFNFELPNVPEQYVHRIGRTARAGREGIAVSYCAPDERPYLRDIEKLTRQKLTVQPLPEGFVKAAEAIAASRIAVKPTRDESNGRRGREMQRSGDRRPGGGGGGAGRPRRTNGLNGKRFDPQPAGARAERPDGQRRPAAATSGEGDRRPRGEAGASHGVRNGQPAGERSHRGPRPNRPDRGGAPHGRNRGQGGGGGGNAGRSAPRDPR